MLVTVGGTQICKFPEHRHLEDTGGLCVRQEVQHFMGERGQTEDERRFSEYVVINKQIMLAYG